jgi:hypothetical protein
MKTIINIGFLTLILIILSGCSSGKTENSTDSLIGPSSEKAISHGDENAIRSCSWYPPAYVNGFDFVENGIGNYKATLIDCIADTCYLTSSGDSGNYLLVCDQQGTWDSSPLKARMHVFFIPSDADEPSDVKDAANVQGTTIIDPDACDLIAIDEGQNTWKLYAFVYDGYDGIISHYSWTIDTSDGDLSDGEWLSTTTIDCGDNAHASGMAVTPLGNDKDYNIIVCDPQEKEVFKHHYRFNSGTSGWEMIGVDLAVLDNISPNIPIDVAITRYDNNDEYHTAYIAVESATDRNEDYIYCYHWDGTDYDENAIADGLGTSDYFHYLVSIDVMKVGADSDATPTIGIQHYNGTVVAHMVNVGLFRSYCFRQVDFYGAAQEDEYNEFIQNYSPVNSSVGEIFPESLAVARYYKKLPPPPSDHHISGQLMFIASRNPDLESGKDVKVYFSQDDT